MSNTQKGKQTHAAQLFFMCCDLADIAPPACEAAARQLTEIANSRIKTQADLLAKALPFEMSRAQLLDFLVSLHGFESWFQWSSLCKRFEKLNAEARANDPYAFRLVLVTLRPFSKNEELPPIIKQLHETMTSAIQHAFGVTPGDARTLFERFMYQLGAENANAPELAYSKQEARYALERFMNFGAKCQLIGLLARTPVRDGRRVAWGSLAALKVKDLLAMPLANRNTDDGFGEPGWVHLSVDAVAMLEQYGEFTGAHTAFGAWLELGNTEISREKSITKARSVGTRLACRDASRELLKPVLDQSVLRALQSVEAPVGFFNEWGTGTIAQVLASWQEQWLELRGRARAKRLADQEPFRDYLLTAEKFTCSLAEDGKFDCIEAALQDKDGRTAAKIAIGMYRGGSSSRSGFAWAMDEIGDRGLVEVALSFATEPELTKCYEGQLDRIAVLREWEVRKDLRGQGLGLALLEEMVPRCMKGPLKPRVFAVRPTPAQYEVPPLEDWAPGYLPELTGPCERLAAYWNNTVMRRNGVLARSVGRVYVYPYVPAAWKNDEIVLATLDSMSDSHGDRDCARD